MEEDNIFVLDKEDAMELLKDKIPLKNNKLYYTNIVALLLIIGTIFIFSCVVYITLSPFILTEYVIRKLIFKKDVTKDESYFPED